MPIHCPDLPSMGLVTSDAHLVLGEGFGVGRRSARCVERTFRQCKKLDELLPQWTGVTREGAPQAFRLVFCSTRAAGSEVSILPVDRGRLVGQRSGPPKGSGEESCRP